MWVTSWTSQSRASNVFVDVNLQSGNCQDIQTFDVVVLIVVLTSAVGDASKLYLIVLFTVAGQAPCSGT